MSEPGTIDPLDFVHGPGLRSPAQREFMRILHELQVHQAEVELQNEALRSTQEELEEARERYFDLYELAPVGYATLDADGRIVGANLMLATLLGVERRHLVGTLLADRMPLADRVRFKALHADALSHTAQKHSVEVGLLTGRTSIPVMLEMIAGEARDPAVRLAVIDLTELRRAEARVLEREARLQTILDNVADGIVTVDADGTIESCNAAAMQLFRVAGPAELTGQSVQRLVPGFVELAERGRVELMVRSADRREFPAEVAVSALKIGGRTTLVGVVTDISERKRRAADLEEALTRFRQMADHIDDAIYVVEADTGKPLYVSPAFEAIYGRAPTTTDGERWPPLAWIHDDDREHVASSADALRTAGTSLDLEYRIVRPDGAVRSVRAREFVIREQNRLTGILHDMTDELALQAELRQAQRLEAIGTLASGVAHDFNNLLMGVGGCVQLALRRLDPKHEAYGYLNRAVGAILRGANLTRQILRFSDTRRGTEEPLELDSVVSGARDLIHSLIGEQITLSVIAGAPGLSIAADPGDLEQVLLNLASNARDAMPDGGHLTLRTETAQGGMVALSVRDTGVGMSEDTKRRVFEPFFTTKEVGKGTGLGLSTVFAVVRRMGGSISVNSAVGEGTTFTLYLPVVIPEPSSLRPPPGDAIRGDGQTILIVDDDPLIRMTVETHVDALGYRALTAANVTDALKIYADGGRRIDLILTDIMMPGLLGSDLSRILQKSAPNLAVVFMSAHPWQDLVRQGHLTENARLLTKPFDALELGAALYQALKEKPTSKPPPALRVFVIDDDRDVVDALRDLLQMEGHVVEVAQSSTVALNRVPEFVPDVVLCDLNLEDAMNGLELVARLHHDERLKKTAFLAVTGMSPAQCRPAALAAGFQDVLTKPLDFQGLSRTLTLRAGK